MFKLEPYNIDGVMLIRKNLISLGDAIKLYGGDLYFISELDKDTLGIIVWAKSDFDKHRFEPISIENKLIKLIQEKL